MKYFLGLIGFWLLLALPADAAIDAIKRNYYTTNANPTIVTSGGGGTNLVNWKIWTDGALYYAQNREASSTISSNDISGLLQNLCGQSVTAGFSTRFEFGSGTDTRSSTSNRYYWFTNTVYVTNGVIFSGQGNAATIFAASPALTGPLIQVGADGNFLSGIARFEKIRFHGDAGAALSVGLKFRNAAEPNVSHCEFNGFTYAGIQVNNTNYNHWSQILDTWFVGGAAGSHCILVDAAPAAVTCDLDISRCKIEPHGGAGITVSNHFRNIRITDSRFGDSSGNSTAPIQIFAGNGFTIANNMFYPFWLSAVPLIRFGDRASATNINALVANNVANGFTPNNMVWIGTNVQGVSLLGNVNPGGNVVTNGSGGNATYVRVDREVIRTDGDITAGGTVSAATGSITTLNTGTQNVTNFNIVNGWNAANATNIPVRALWGSGGTNTAATNGTIGLILASAGNGGVYWSSDATGGGAMPTNLPISSLWGSGGTNTAATNGTAGMVQYSAGNGGIYWGAAPTGGTASTTNAISDTFRVRRATWAEPNASATAQTWGIGETWSASGGTPEFVEPDANGPMRARIYCNGTTGQNAGLNANGWCTYYSGKNADWEARFITGGLTNLMRLWVGLASTSIGNMTGSDTPNYNYAAFRFSDTINSKFYFCTSASGGSVTATDTGITIQPATQYRLRVVEDTSNARWIGYINGTAVATNTATLPSAAKMQSTWGWQTGENVAKTNFLCVIHGSCDW